MSTILQNMKKKSECKHLDLAVDKWNGVWYCKVCGKTIGAR